MDYNVTGDTMFFETDGFAFQLLGVYHIHRKQRDVINRPRDHIAFSYRIQGSSTFYHNGEESAAASGSVVFLPDGLGFRNRNEGDEEILVVHMRALGNRPAHLEVYPDMQLLEPLFQQLFSCWETGNYNRCMCILYRIFEELQTSIAAARSVPAVIAPGVAMLREQFRQPGLSIAQAAEHCFVSEVYFRRIYRQHFGTSPLQDVLQLRFEHALRLLNSGYYTTEEAARLSGFNDVKYFRTAFKKRYGCSPLRWLADKK